MNHPKLIGWISDLFVICLWPIDWSVTMESKISFSGSRLGEQTNTIADRETFQPPIRRVEVRPGIAYIHTFIPKRGEGRSSRNRQQKAGTDIS